MCWGKYLQPGVALCKLLLLLCQLSHLVNNQVNEDNHDHVQQYLLPMIFRIVTIMITHEDEKNAV